MNKWDFTKKIEDMSPEDVAKRSQAAYEEDMGEIVVMPFVGTETVVNYTDDNQTPLIARCPATGILDAYRYIINVVPDKHLPELKSLKFYFMRYEPLPISHEHICSKIYEELHATLKPKSLYIAIDTATRGGIKTLVERGEYSGDRAFLEDWVRK